MWNLVVAAWRQLDQEERESAFQMLNQLRTGEAAGQESQGASLMRSLGRIADHVGGEPSADEYRAAYRELSAAGEDVAPLHEQVGHWGSWKRAKEALFLSATETPRRIESRFCERTLGKVWRYSEDVVRETLLRAVESYGRVLSVAEFDWLARARGRTGEGAWRGPAPAQPEPVPQALEVVGRRAAPLRLRRRPVRRALPAELASRTSGRIAR